MSRSDDNRPEQVSVLGRNGLSHLGVNRQPSSVSKPLQISNQKRVNTSFYRETYYTLSVVLISEWKVTVVPPTKHSR